MSWDQSGEEAEAEPECEHQTQQRRRQADPDARIGSSVDGADERDSGERAPRATNDISPNAVLAELSTTGTICICTRAASGMIIDVNGSTT